MSFAYMPIYVYISLSRTYHHHHHHQRLSLSKHALFFFAPLTPLSFSTFTFYSSKCTPFRMLPVSLHISILSSLLLSPHSILPTHLSLPHPHRAHTPSSPGDNGSLYFSDWSSGHVFQSIDFIRPQPGSLDSESGVFATAFDRTGSRLITCEADKTIKIWKEDETAVR